MLRLRALSVCQRAVAAQSPVYCGRALLATLPEKDSVGNETGQPLFKTDFNLINSGIEPAYVDRIVQGQLTRGYDRKTLVRRLQENPFLLEDAPDSMRDDEEIVYEAIRVNGLVLGCVSDRLRSCRAVVREAVSASASALAFASEEILDDAEFLLGLHGRAKVHPIPFASARLRKDTGFVLKAIEIFGQEGLRYADPSVWNDRDFVLEMVRRDGLLLKQASFELRSDKEVVLVAAERTQYAVSYANKSLKEDPDVVAAAARAKAKAKALKVKGKQQGRRAAGWEVVGSGEREG